MRICEKKSKYIKGTNCRETLRSTVELRSDETVRDIAMKQLDQRIIGVISRELLAADTRFHRTCYRNYTRPRMPEHTETSYMDKLKIGYENMNTLHER